MGYVEIPKLQTMLPIYHGTDDAVLQVAVGHLAGTSLPIGGQEVTLLFQDIGDCLLQNCFLI